MVRSIGISERSGEPVRGMRQALRRQDLRLAFTCEMVVAFGTVLPRLVHELVEKMPQAAGSE
jgi:hypothetical protein